MMIGYLLLLAIVPLATNAANLRATTLVEVRLRSLVIYTPIDTLSHPPLTSSCVVFCWE